MAIRSWLDFEGLVCKNMWNCTDVNAGAVQGSCSVLGLNFSVARQWLSSRHVIATIDTHAKQKTCWKLCFLCGPWMLHTDYYRKGSVEKENLWSWVSRTWRQDELIGGKPPVVKWLWLVITREYEQSPNRESWDGSQKSKRAVSDDRQPARTWARKQGNVHCWKPLPSSTVKTVTENTSLCMTVICKV
jgi:hypothetical protein